MKNIVKCWKFRLFVIFLQSINIPCCVWEAVEAMSSRCFLSTWARGGPGGSSMTVTTLVLSARKLFEVQRFIARSTNLLLGLIHWRSPDGLSICCSLDFSTEQASSTAWKKKTKIISLVSLVYLLSSKAHLDFSNLMYQNSEISWQKMVLILVNKVL